MTRKMKDSEIEWIGEIPEDWEINRLQWGLSEIVKRNNPIQTESILSLTKDRGVIPYEDKGNQGNKSKTNYEDYKLAYPNTIVMNSMNVIIGSVGLSDFFGCVSPVYYVFKARENNDIRFFNYIFQTTKFQEELKKYANGILEIRLRVSSENVLKRKISFPKFEIQKRISDILDKKMEQIENIESTITQEIQTLENYKKSVITEAVTKGLDKNVEMKDSGIEWIGEIPKHWNLITIKYIAKKITDGAHIAPDTSDEIYNFVSVVDIDNNGNIDFENCLKITEAQYKYLKRNGCKVNIDDILISKDGTVGKTVYINANDEFVVASSLVIIRPNLLQAIPKFIKYALDSNLVSEQLNSLVSGSALKRISVYKNSNLKIVFTADKKDQAMIVDYLDNKTKLINDAISAKQKQLETLEEYKKSLIYEYVTGKKEVNDGEES
ncbi:restriction endonuclease subunit S [Finegoldia magna]|uniref:Restriction endonuclease subunit S n=1 Tax=Finegoldia magna TaxID=1260 RepID=A0A2N6STA2_FINMA|nr:restriction endonuclease subunit S [Finegoldia magna]PMC60315.1 restriction endonuclease subunit S [Finegoldia magna]